MLLLKPCLQSGRALGQVAQGTGWNKILYGVRAALAYGVCVVNVLKRPAAINASPAALRYPVHHFLKGRRVAVSQFCASRPDVVPPQFAMVGIPSGRTLATVLAHFFKIGKPVSAQKIRISLGVLNRPLPSPRFVTRLALREATGRPGAVLGKIVLCSAKAAFRAGWHSVDRLKITTILPRGAALKTLEAALG